MEMAAAPVDVYAYRAIGCLLALIDAAGHA